MEKKNNPAHKIDRSRLSVRTDNQKDDSHQTTQEEKKEHRIYKRARKQLTKCKE